MASKPAHLPPVAVVVSRYNHAITGPMLEDARAAYTRAGGDPGSLAIIEAPGAFELPVLAAAAARTGLYRGVVALGCIIRGQTRHDRYLAAAVAGAIADIGVQTGVPVAFGVLTTDDAAQARARAGGDKGNKGADAMTALIDTMGSLDAIARAAQANSPGFEHRIASTPNDKSRGDI